MVVGDQDLQAQGARPRHTLHAGNAVVHRDQHVGTLGFDALGNRRGQAVAIHHPVGHHKVHPLGAQHAQTAQGHGAGGGPIAVVIGHDAQGGLARNGIGQQHGGLLNAFEVLQRQQVRQVGVEVLRPMHATGREQARQQGMHAGLLQRPQAAGGNIALSEFHRSNKACCKVGARQARHQGGQTEASDWTTQAWRVPHNTS